MIRPYHGITPNGSIIVGVAAHNFDDAETQIIRILSRPDRADVLASWIKQGKLIELEYTDSEDPAAIELCNQVMRHLKAAGS